MRRTALIGCLSGLSLMAGMFATASLPAVAIDDALPASPDRQVLVVSVNLAEAIYGDDNDETRDVYHFATRVNSVLSAAGRPAPDVVMLQESNLESATLVAQRLTAVIGQPYVVGAKPEDGNNAKLVAADPPNAGGITRDTAILYNTNTMKWPDGPYYQGFGIGAASVVDPNTAWWNTQAPFYRLVEKTSGEGYVFSSVRFLRQARIRTDLRQFYYDAWATALKNKMEQLIATEWPNSLPVIAGDFNNYPCKAGTYVDVGAANCDSAAEYNDMWNVFVTDSPTYKATRKDRIDHFFTRANVISAATGADTAYASLIGDMATCYANYTAGNGATSTIPGCAAYFYSDHEFYWTTVQHP